MAEVRAPIGQDGLTVHPDCWVHLPELSSFCSRKSRIWWHFGITPWESPHAYTNRRWGNTAGMQNNTVLGCRVMLMMT